MKYYIETYGCQMNEYDSQKISSAIESLGYKKSENYKDCEIVLLNTCSIREKADEKVYSTLGRINIEKKHLAKNGKYMIIIVTGCVPETFKNQMFLRAPYIDILLGPQSYIKLKDFIIEVKNSICLENQEAKVQKKHLSHFDFTTTDKFDFLNEEKNQFNGISAYVSVQEGCDKFCTYCVVPNTRGREVSRKRKDIIFEVKKLIELGAKDIMFLGQNVTAYKDNDYTLANLIEETANFQEIQRIKYTTSHPTDMHDDIINAHRNIDKLIPYLHLPVQSGSNNILKKMNRKYTRELYFEKIAQFKQAKSNIIFSSDFIVGFPGENEEDFEDTIDLIRKVQYKAQCFSFCYSKRPGTVAATMKNHVDEKISLQRLYKLQALLTEQRDNFHHSLKDKTLDVIFDNLNTKHEFQISGRSEFMQSVIVNCNNKEEVESLFGKKKKVLIESINPNSLIGRIIS